MTQKEIDALDCLRPVSMVVKPEFYVRWTRWLARTVVETLEFGRPEPFSRKARSIAIGCVAPDDRILETRAGDGFSYRGITVRLEESEPEIRFNCCGPGGGQDYPLRPAVEITQASV